MQCVRLEEQLPFELVDIVVSSGWMRHPDLKPGRFVKLAVCDTGCGIDSASVERIFDPFFTTKRAGEGTGLGLAVVHGIVKAHKGAITVATIPARGSTFTVFLPAVEGAPIPCSQGSPCQPQRSRAHSRH